MSWSIVLLIVAGLGIYAGYLVLKSRGSSKSEIIDETEEFVKELESKRDQDVGEVLDEEAERAEELAAAAKIKDKKKRMARLAEIGNRGSRKPR